MNVEGYRYLAVNKYLECDDHFALCRSFPTIQPNSIPP
jgi:hypothetical protein